MTQVEYAVWVLVLQISAYAGYLSFGLQTAVGRFVAFANEQRDAKQRNTIFSTAIFGLSIAGCLALCMLLAIAFAAHGMFPEVPSQLIAQMKFALIIVGASIALGLPASAWEGLFIGLQRNEVPAIVTGIAKLTSALGLVAAAVTGHSIVAMAVILATVNVFSYAVEYVLARNLAPEVRFQRGLIQKSAIRELGGYCFSLTIWSFSTMLVTGLDLVLVGRFQFDSLAAYGVAAGLVSFVAGAQYAIFGAIMSEAAVVHARQDSAQLGRMVLTSTRLGVLLLLLTGMLLLIYATPFMRLWVGAAYATQGHQLLTVLLIANMVRLIGVPYAVVLIGTGQQRQVLVTPLAEGLTNLAASILLGYRFGAIGVAGGTLVGACVNMGAHLWYSMPRTSAVIRFTRRQFIFSSVLMPLVWTSPLVVIAVCSVAGCRIHPATMIGGLILTAAGATVVLRRSGVGLSLLRTLSETKPRSTDSQVP